MVWSLNPTRWLQKQYQLVNNKMACWGIGHQESFGIRDGARSSSNIKASFSCTFQPPNCALLRKELIGESHRKHVPSSLHTKHFLIPVPAKLNMSVNCAGCCSSLGAMRHATSAGRNRNRKSPRNPTPCPDLEIFNYIKNHRYCNR